MALTKADLRNLVKQAVGNRTATSGTTIDNTWYDARVYSGYRRLVTYQGPVTAPGMRQPQMRRLQFREFERRTASSLTTAGLTTNFVTPVETGVAYVTDIYDTTNNKGLDRVSEREIRRLDPDEAGVPRLWCPGSVSGTVGYYIWPRPQTTGDDINIHEYTYVYPAALSGDSDTPAIPDTWHLGIVYASVSEAAMFLDMPEKSAEAEQQFQAFIAQRRTPMEDESYAGYAGTRNHIPIGTRWR